MRAYGKLLQHFRLNKTSFSEKLQKHTKNCTKIFAELLGTQVFFLGTDGNRNTKTVQV